MPLPDHLQILWRSRWLIISLAAVAAGTALVLTFTARPTYVATATLHVATASAAGVGSVRSDDIEYVDRLENTYGELATSRPFVDDLIARLELDERPEIDAGGVPNTELLVIRATTDNRESAARSANAAATLLIARVRGLRGEPGAAEMALQGEVKQLEGELVTERAEYVRLAGAVGKPAADARPRAKVRQAEQQITFLQEQIADLRSQLSSIRVARRERAHALSVVQFATAEGARSESHLIRNLVIAALAGLLVGVAIAYGRERLRPQVYSEGELRKATGAPILGTIPAVPIRGGEPIFNSGSSAEEAFTRLRLTLFAARREAESCQLVLITSPQRCDGKTMVGVNLARAIASSGHRALLIDGDIRRPSLHERLELPLAPGFVDVLNGIDATSVTHATSTPELFAIPSGAAVIEGQNRLPEGTQLDEVLHKLSADYDYILLDSAPILDASETLRYASGSDAVILVIRHSATPLDLVEQSLVELQSMNLPFVGLVLNRFERPFEHSPRETS
jgi:Mrp family chromosome partitioning ATPase/capsular polysaccharide biosynthesis protein